MEGYSHRPRAKDRQAREQLGVDALVTKALPQMVAQTKTRQRMVMQLEIPGSDLQGAPLRDVLLFHHSKNAKKREAEEKAKRAREAAAEARKRKREEERRDKEEKKRRRIEEKEERQRQRVAGMRLGCILGCGRKYSAADADEGEWVCCEACKGYIMCPECYAEDEGEKAMAKHEGNHKIKKKN